MSGNVSEWCLDLYVSYWYNTPESRNRNPLCNNSLTNSHVERGGSWFSRNVKYLRTSHRSYYEADLTFFAHGIRCIKNIEVN